MDAQKTIPPIKPPEKKQSTFAAVKANVYAASVLALLLGTVYGLWWVHEKRSDEGLSYTQIFEDILHWASNLPSASSLPKRHGHSAAGVSIYKPDDAQSPEASHEQGPPQSTGFTAQSMAPPPKLVDATQAEAIQPVQPTEEPFPEHGSAYYYDQSGETVIEASLLLHTDSKPGQKYVVTAIDYKTKVPFARLYLEGGKSIKVGMPKGLFTFKIETGTVWYGDQVGFGSSGVSWVVPAFFSFAPGAYQSFLVDSHPPANLQAQMEVFKPGPLSDLRPPPSRNRPAPMHGPVRDR